MTSNEALHGDLLGEEVVFTLEELCRSCTIKSEYVISLVEEGILEPEGTDRTRWQFTISSIRRVRTARRLQRDLGVNLAGAALALDLMDRIAKLERLR